MSIAVSVAMLMGTMGMGGVEAVMMNYVRQLAGKDIPIDIILHENSPFSQRRELETLGCAFFTIPPYSRPFAYHKALVALFRQRRYTIVHAHLSTVNLFPLLAAWRAGISVRICHNHSTAHWGEGIKTFLKHLLRFPARLFATDYFASGERAGRWMFGDRLFDAGRVFVLPNAIEGKRYAFCENARNRIRRTLGLEESRFVVGHVGRFAYQKNHAFLLDVFAAVHRRRPDSVLLLLGEGPLRPRLEEQAKRLGLGAAVRFLGTRDDMGEWYSAMDVLVLPSFYEGMPLVAVEAQANGLPCLLADAITREALLAENAAMLSLKQSPEAWATAALAGSRRAAHVPEAFAIAVQAENLLEAYKLAAGRALSAPSGRSVAPPDMRPRSGGA